MYLPKKEMKSITETHNNWCLSAILNPITTPSLSKNNVLKGENAGNQRFLLFPQCFLPPGREFKCFM